MIRPGFLPGLMHRNASPADRRGFKMPQKIAEEVFCPEPLGVHSISEFSGEKDEITF